MAAEQSQEVKDLYLLLNNPNPPSWLLKEADRKYWETCGDPTLNNGQIYLTSVPVDEGPPVKAVRHCGGHCDTRVAVEFARNELGLGPAADRLHVESDLCELHSRAFNFIRQAPPEVKSYFDAHRQKFNEYTQQVNK